MSNFLSYIWQSVQITVLTFILAFGIPLLLAFIQNFISSYNERLAYRIMGRKLYYFFIARIGVPIHELGHALFAVIFRHKITDMKLFDPNGPNGSLGYVNHSYNKKSLFQNIGNFFIGIGPVILGSFLLFALSSLLFNVSASGVEESDQVASGQVALIFNRGWALIKEIFTSGSFLKSFLFLYLVFAIGSNITLSKADIKGAKKGFGFLVLFIFILHFATLWLSDSPSGITSFFAGLVSRLSMILGVAILLNLLFSVILTVLSRILRR
ncbi:MAG: hypothetical protein PF450_14480 [Bacteroidales bacterium]|jgi:hypothetical protein|nr:hypothetical protein [Bacteroidales bacterium]